MIRKLLISPKELCKREVILTIVISAVLSIVGSIIISVVVVRIYNASTEPVVAEHNHNITDLHLDPSHEAEHDRLLQLEEMLHNATARIAELEANEHQSMISMLQVRMEKLEEAFRELETSKASQEQVDKLTNSSAFSIALLNDSKVDNSEFNDLVDNVSELASTKVDRATVMELGEEVADLAETALNETHFNQRIDRLELSKANQTQFEELVSNFTSLANTTVRTGEFLSLSERVEDIDNTTVKIEDFTTKVTTLQDDIEWINVTLTTKVSQDMVSELQLQVDQLERETNELEDSKASQDEVDQLFESIGLSIALLNDSKVDNSEFNDLVGTVSELASTKADRSTVMELEVQLHDLAEIALNHTHYDQLQDGIDRLESSKASQREFEELVLNFTSLANTTVRTRDFLLLSERVVDIDNTTVKKDDFTTKVTTLQDDIEWINVTLTTKASQDTVSELQVQVGQLERETRELEGSKASQDEVDQLFDSIGLSIALLNDSKVDNSVFNNFVDTVSKLISTKVDTATVLELGEHLKELATTSLNHTHYDQLQDGIDRLESSKVSQTQFEELVSNLTTLANTTVRTGEFLHLSKRVEDIDNTTEEFFMKVATLNGDIEHINRTLDMKADQQAILDEITTLRDTTVRRDEFQELSDTVETLKTSKADQSDLDDLRQTSATKTSAATQPLASWMITTVAIIITSMYIHVYL